MPGVRPHAGDVPTWRGRAPPELRRQFIVLVAALNLALLAMALGVLVLRSRPALGLALLAGGVGAAALAWRRYRGLRERLPLPR